MRLMIACLVLLASGCQRIAVWEQRAGLASEDADVDLDEWSSSLGDCDESCALPDPDCTDTCVTNNYYGDRVCDTFCASRDPDCDDPCVLNHYYGDGTCDTDCFRPDPDCP